MIGTSPPGPFRCGSTTWSAKPVATAASKALPPFSSMAVPAAVASQWVEATTPKVPTISGRVVNLVIPFAVLLPGPDLVPPAGAAAHQHVALHVRPHHRRLLANVGDADGDPSSLCWSSGLHRACGM